MKITKVDVTAPDTFKPFSVVIEVRSQDDLSVLRGSIQLLKGSSRLERREFATDLNVALGGSAFPLV